MTFILEASRPLLLRPGLYRSRSMTRAWWLWFAVGWLHIPFKEFCETSWQWVGGGR